MVNIDKSCNLAIKFINISFLCGFQNHILIRNEVLMINLNLRKNTKTAPIHWQESKFKNNGGFIRCPYRYSTDAEGSVSANTDTEMPNAIW